MPGKQTINLVTYDDRYRQVRQPVSALVIGPLAVHRELGNDYRQWAVSHVRTGYRIRGAIKTKARALRVAEALQFLDWNFRSPQSHNLKVLGPKVEWAINLTL